MQREFIKSLSIKTILLDSNAYFRLADNLFPLLSESCGKNPSFELKILGGTIGEYNFQSRLRTKFDWVSHTRHKEDRRNGFLKLKNGRREDIEKTYAFMLEDCRDRNIGCSSFDIRCLSTAFELTLTLVTDDRDLFSLAREYEVECYSTLDLMNLMNKENRIDMNQVQDTVYMWDYMDDLPSNFHDEFLRIFKIEPIQCH
jgi:hypothetical protein